VLNECLQFKELNCQSDIWELAAHDCNPLIEKFTARINSWLSKNLYFSSIFILLKKVFRSIKQKFYRFLWSGNDSSAASLLEKKWLEMWFVYLKRREL
jgi:hypothetical protein